MMPKFGIIQCDEVQNGDHPVKLSTSKESATPVLTFCLSKFVHNVSLSRNIFRLHIPFQITVKQIHLFSFSILLFLLS
jgi:hypothetical protein